MLVICQKELHINTNAPYSDMIYRYLPIVYINDNFLTPGLNVVSRNGYFLPVTFVYQFFALVGTHRGLDIKIIRVAA